jgi:hypothetical protein
MIAVMRQFILSAIVLGLSACQNGHVCTSQLVAALVLTIVDAETGEPIPDPVVSFRIDGGELQMPESWIHHQEDVVVVAYEHTGLYEVAIEAEGYEPAQAEYDVGLDEAQCHAETVRETIELVPIE